jgi:hypothetical protein
MTAPIGPGRSKDWVKVKNRKHPAMSRVMDAFSWPGETAAYIGVKVETMGSPLSSRSGPAARTAAAAGAAGAKRPICCGACRSTACTVSPSETHATSVETITIAVVLALDADDGRDCERLGDFEHDGQRLALVHAWDLLLHTAPLLYKTVMMVEPMAPLTRAAPPSRARILARLVVSASGAEAEMVPGREEPTPPT